MDYKRDIFDGDDVSIEVSRRGKIKRFFSRNFSNKFKNLKIKYKKDPKKFAVVTLGLLVAFSALIGSSYAYLTYISKTNSSTVINAGTLALVFKNGSNAITLDGALPMKDSDGLNSKDIYEFSIENTGSISATYRVTLDNTCSLGKSYEVGGASVTPNICIPDNYVKVGISENGGEYKVLERKSANEESSYIIATGSLNAGKTISYKMKIWLDYSTPNTYNTTENSISLYAGKLGLSYEQGNSGNLDKSGANAPVLDSAMIPVYYDEASSTWKKADSNNSNKKHKWYDYNNKMWANSVTVSSTNRSTYQSAEAGITIPMDDILTMQVWIPRYKYKIWNYNADGEQTSEPQEIKITFEKGTAKTGEITCEDKIQGENGDGTSETCKLKSTNDTCTDDTCNNKTYTHPAFTFGEEEIEGFWIGKFELTGTINDITVKPNLSSLREQTVSSFETNIMNMKNSGNKYGFNTNTDTHMIKNSEWGAVAYLSHSKYGTCSGGTCTEVNINNSSGHYTGRSGGSPVASPSEEGTYKYNQTKLITTTMTGGTEITPTVTNDTIYPWTTSDGLYKSSNQGQNSTTTNLSFDFTAPTDNTYLSFDWSVSSENANYDYLYYTITKDGTALSDTGTSTKIGGTDLETTESALIYKNVTKKLDKGAYKLTFTYIKDSSGANGTDTGYIKNIKVLDSPTVKETKTPIEEGKNGPSASTTHNIYGVYDMSGGANEYTMANIVNTDGTTMIPSSSDYTTSTYPDSKYYDKYSYSTSYISRKRSKLGDGIKEVYKSSVNSWYGDYSCLAGSYGPWFSRGGYFDLSSNAGVFRSADGGSGFSESYDSSRPVITP